ncbi:MAG: hypothetical protein K2X93_29550 [Candidatus Obscuribacterales bacterium]|nr:hypothetical protein [Candidatus Obscuribacterales bacterium]
MNAGLSSFDFNLDSSSGSDQRNDTKSTRDIFVSLYLEQLQRDDTKSGSSSLPSAFSLSADAPPEAKVDNNAGKDAPAAPGVVALAKVPHGDLVIRILGRSIGVANEVVKAENGKRAPGTKPEEAFNEEKLKEEWKRGEFGPESKRLYAKVHQLIERDVLGLAVELDSRGIAFPPGCPIQPEKSVSGSGLPETDESFRARVRNGEIKFSFPPKALNGDGVPDAGDVTTFANHFTWTQYAKLKCVQGAIDSQAASVEFHLKGTEKFAKSGDLSGWKRPSDLAPDQSERWANATMAWVNTIQRVHTYADTVAAFNAATSDKGFQFPGLTDLFKKIKLPDNATVFPDEALKEANFPGTIKRGPDGLITEMKLDLPATSERTPENLRKMQKVEEWLRKYGPSVDKVWGQMLDTDSSPERTLMWVADGDFQREKASTFADLQELNGHLSGNQKDVNQKVKLPGDELDWFVKSVSENGQYVLEKRAPNGEPFNMKRSGFTTETCDKDGKPDPKGDYVSVTSYRKYEWARFHAYNGWNYLGSIRPIEQINAKPQVFHKNDFVPIIEDNRMRILQAKHLKGWSEAMDNARQTGNLVGTAVDIGMCVTGTIEFRAAWVAAKKLGEVSAKQVAKEGLKGAWHVGLGATGFAKQAIENNFSWGHDFMQVRHKAIMADMALQIGPNKFQKGFWEQLPVLGKAEGKTAMEAYGEWALTKEARFIDSLLGKAHKTFTGFEVAPPKFLPHVGVFFLADTYYLAEATNMAADFLKNDHRGALVDGALRHRSMNDGRKPLLYGPESEARLKSATGLLLNEYGTKLGGKSAELLGDAVNKLFLPPDSPERVKLRDDAERMFLKAKTNDKERLAAAVILLALNENHNGEAALLEKPGHYKYTVDDVLNYVHKQSEQSSDLDVRLIAGDTLFRLDRCNSVKINALDEALKRVQGELKAKPQDAELKQRAQVTKDALKNLEQFRKSINYNSADFTTLLMEVLKSDKATKEQKISAIASPSGVRLAMLLEHRRYDANTQLDGRSKFETDALLYGRDAEYIQNALLEAVRNSGNPNEVRAVAAYALRATVGSDRHESMLKLNAFTASKDGDLHKTITDELLRELQVNPKASEGTQEQRDKLLLNSFLAGKTIKDCGVENLFADAPKVQQLVAEVFAKQMTSSMHSIARLAAVELTPAMLKSLPLDKQHALREYVLNPMRAPRTNSDRDGLRLCLIEKSSELFADGTPQQKSMVALYLEAMLIPGAGKEFEQQNPHAGFPSFEPGFTEARIRALQALSKIDPSRALELAQFAIHGGAYGQQEIPKDNAHVRLAAVNVIEQLKPFDWQKIAIDTLRVETDPAVLQKLWNLEFAARTNIDPVRLEREMNGLRERVEKRGGDSWTASASKPGTYTEDRIGKNCDQPGCEACTSFNRGASLGLLMTATQESMNGDLKQQLKAVDGLFKVADRIPNEIAQLTGPIENALLSSPNMHPAVRERLLNLYVKVARPGSNGVVSKDEGALVLSRMLGNSIRDLQSEKGSDSSFVKANQQLSQTIFDNLKGLKSTASVPTLLALSYSESLPPLLAMTTTVKPAAHTFQPEGKIAAQTFQSEALDKAKAAALEQLRDLVGTTHLADAAATAEVSYARNGGTNGAILGAAESPEALAELVANALADSSLDAFQVVATMGSAINAKPIEGLQDPRMKTLQIALRDKNDIVRLAAAKLCLESNEAGIRESAIFALADVAKNGSMPPSKSQAMDLLNQSAALHPALVQRALAETVVRELSTSERAPVALDVRMQRHFENLRRAFSGNELGVGWLQKDFDHFVRTQRLNMLSRELREETIDKDIQKIWEAHAGMFKSASARTEAVKTALNAHVKKISTEFQSLTGSVVNPDVDAKQRQQAIQALVYVINDNGKSLSLSQDNKWALHTQHRPSCSSECVDRAVDAIVAVSSGKGLAAGEMEPILRQLLTGNATLSRNNKTKLVSALDALTTNGGISRENTASILALAFETEMRFMPSANQSEYEGSIQLQKALLAQMANYGNAELVPVLTYFSIRHSNDGVRKAAAETRDKFKSTAVDIAKRDVEKILADTRGEEGYTKITFASDERLPLLKAALKDENLPSERRFRAAEVLMTASNRALSESDRKDAAKAYARIGVRYPHPDESACLKAITVILDRNNRLFTEEERNSAANALGNLSIGGGEQVRELAMFHLTKLDGKQANLAVDQVLRSALIRADRSDCKSTIDSAIDRVIAMQKLAQEKGEPGPILKDQVKVLSRLVLSGNTTAQKALTTLSAQMGADVIRIAGDAAQDYLAGIAAENVQRAKQVQAIKELARQQKFSEKAENDFIAKSAPISPDPLVLKRYADLVVTLEKSLGQSKETDAALFRAYGLVGHINGAEITALRARVDTAIDRLKVEPVTDKTDPRKPWLEWYEKETHKEPTETELLSKHKKTLTESKDEKLRLDSVTELLVVAATTQNADVRQDALASLKTLKGQERAMLELMVKHIAKEASSPSRRLTGAERDAIKEIQNSLDIKSK